MQLQEHAPDLTQRTTFEDRISRRVHDRIVARPGVSDRRDGVHRMERLNDFGVSDHGLAGNIRRRWLRSTSASGMKDSSMPYVYAQRKGIGAAPGSAAENISPQAPTVPHGVIARQEAPGSPATVPSPATDAGSVAHGSAAHPSMGDVAAGTTSNPVASRPSEAEHAMPVVRAQGRVIAPASIAGARTTEHGTQRGTLAQATSSSLAVGGAGRPAGVQRSSSNPLSGEPSNLMNLSPASTENRAQPQTARSRDNPNAVGQTRASAASDNPLTSSGTAPGALGAVQRTETHTAATWGAPIVQRRATGQRSTPAQQNTARSDGGASPTVAGSPPLNLARTGNERAGASSSGEHLVGHAASDAAPGVSGVSPLHLARTGGDRPSAGGSGEQSVLHAAPGAAQPATVQRRDSAPVMVAPLYTRHANRNASGATGMPRMQSERTASAVATVAASDPILTRANAQDTEPALVLPPAASLPASPEATPRGEKAMTSVYTSPGDLEAALPSTQRSSASEAADSPTVVQGVPASAQARTSDSATELVLRTKLSEPDASPAVPSGGQSSATAQVSSVGAMSNVVNALVSPPMLKRAADASLPAAAEGVSSDPATAGTTPLPIGGKVPAVRQNAAPAMSVKMPLPAGHSIRRTGAPDTSSATERRTVRNPASSSTGPARHLTTASTPADHAAPSMGAALVQRSARADAPPHGEPPPAAPHLAAELPAGQPLVHVSVRRVTRAFDSATKDRQLSSGLSREEDARTAALRTDSVQEMAIQRTGQRGRVNADTSIGADAFAAPAYVTSQRAALGGQVRTSKREAPLTTAAKGAPIAAKQPVTVVQASPSLTHHANGVSSNLPVRQWYTALASPVGSSLAAAPGTAGDAGRLPFAQGMTPLGRAPWTQQRATAANASVVQRQPLTRAPAATSASASADAAEQAPVQSPTPESIDLERVASAVYRIIRDRLMIERESKGL